MFVPLDAALVFGFLTFFHLWGGAAIGAGVRLHRVLPLTWGLLLGAGPLWLGIERVLKLGSWAGLAWQVACLAGSALAVGLALPRVRGLFARPGMDSLMIGTFIMGLAVLLGAWFFRLGSEPLSLIVGGAGFLFGAMWVGAGIARLRGGSSAEEQPRV